MAYLRFLNEAGQISCRTLDSERFVIGRTESANLIFDSDMISREHLAIELEADGRFRIRDLGSRNKTYINGELAGDTLLNPGDIIRAGDRIAEFVDDSASPTRIDLEFLTPDQAEPPHCEWLKIKTPVPLTIAQLEQLAQLAGDHALTARSEDIADTALAQAILAAQAERGFVALRGEGKTDLHVIAHRALAVTPGGSRTPVSNSFVLTPILQTVAGRYPQTAGQVNLKLGYAAVGLVAPLTYQGQVIGVLYVDRPASKRPFPTTSLQYALAAGAQIGSLLGEASRKLARMAPREGHAWMTTSRRLQSSLPSTAESNDSFTASYRLHPGRARCGDVGQVIPLDEQRCCIALVDGGGHGVAGVAQAASLLAAIRAAVQVSEDALTDPSELFNSLNRMMAASPARQVLPCTFIGIDMASGKLVYICAGGRPPLVMVAPGRLVTLDQPSLVLGIDKDYLYEPTRVNLPERYRVVCYTDGVIDATNPGSEPLGEQRLHDVLLERDAFGSAEELTGRISQLVTGHIGRSQADDDAMALVVAYG